MDQTTTATTTATTSTHPVGLEALRLQLKEDGRFYKSNQNSEEAHERLLHTLQANDYREIITAVADRDDFANAFAWAGGRGHVDILQAFLNHGMNINIKNIGTWTALMFASLNGKTKIVEMLLENNANPDIQDNSGWTALMLASQRGYKEVIRLLLDHGVDIDLRNKDGETALDLADDEDIKEIIQNHVNNSYVLK